jgi:hypothetical protein
LASAGFWLHGVAMVTTGAFGLVGNALTLYVLPRLESSSNRRFHRLLMALAVVDTLVIIFFVGDVSICGQLMPAEPTWYRFSYAHFIHPLRNMTLTAAIFTVVAISAERFKAICR